LVYRGCPYNCGGAELISTALGQTFEGPYKRVDTNPIFTNGAEDPFVWQDKRNNWHMLLHSLEDGGGFGGPNIGRHAYSPSFSENWVFNTNTLAYNVTVQFTDGTHIDYGRRERPQLYFSPEGVPLYLINGVQEKGHSSSYTLIQPFTTVSKYGNNPDVDAAILREHRHAYQH